MEQQWIKDIMEEHKDKTCVIVKNKQVLYTSTDFGVKPLVDFYQAYGTSEEPLWVFDKIMGKGAVLLAVLCGASHVITPKMSETAYDYAISQGLVVQVETLVPMIINRTKDGRCPVESAVLDIDDVMIGYQVILDTLKVLRG